MNRSQRPRIDKKNADEIISMAPPCPDPLLRQRILAALTGEDDPEQRPVLIRRIEAGQILLVGLRAHGRFVRTVYDNLLFMNLDERRLYDLGSMRWAAYLYSISGANPAGTDFKHLREDCIAAAMEADPRPIVRVSHWDAAEQVLRVSRFDGTVYRLDGSTIVDEPNGEHVLFYDRLEWEPYSPDFTSSAVPALSWLTDELPNWAGDYLSSGLALRTWVLATFFTELCPTRPILVLIGEKGSGKSMVLRLLLRFVFGANAELGGVPNRPDGFTAAASSMHILVLDNLDDPTLWLRDRLARFATGSEDYHRILYTSNERGTVRYRGWVAVTTRTAETLRRDDLADRLVLLPVGRIQSDVLQAERNFLELASLRRNAWWGDVLVRLNGLVAQVRGGQLRGKANLRMADWETLGQLLAQTEDMLVEPDNPSAQGEKAAAWDRFIADLQASQAAFLLEEDPIVDALELWLSVSGNNQRLLRTRELYDELTQALLGGKRSAAGWYKSPVGLGKRLANIRRELRTRFDVEWVEERGRQVLYRFSRRGTRG